jgi:hypothetical protein
VRLVDGEQRNTASVQEPHGRFHAEPFGGKVEQIQLAGQRRGLNRAPLLEILGGVQKSRAHPERAQGIHLVLHQRDERGYDNTDAIPNERRDLITERFPTARWHEHQSIPAGDHVIDDLLLTIAERVVPEHPAKHR